MIGVYSLGVFRYKTSVAVTKVYILNNSSEEKGLNKWIINNRSFSQYFNSLFLGESYFLLNQVFSLTNEIKLEDVLVVSKIKGGGSSGQFQALIRSIVKGLLLFYLKNKTTEEYVNLKSNFRRMKLISGFLKPKESKKYGRYRARAKEQFSKR